MKIDIILDPTHTTEEFSELGVIAEKLGFNAVLTANYPSATGPILILWVSLARIEKLMNGSIADG
jgi:hypothetical protein